MKQLFAALATTVLLISHSYAAEGEVKPKKEPTAAQKAQRERMKACNQEAKAKELKGDERKAFMQECLKSENSAASKSAKADKVAAKEKAEQCKQEAAEKKLKGDARKTYLASCLET